MLTSTISLHQLPVKPFRYSQGIPIAFVEEELLRWHGNSRTPGPRPSSSVLTSKPYLIGFAIHWNPLIVNTASMPRPDGRLPGPHLRAWPATKRNQGYCSSTAESPVFTARTTQCTACSWRRGCVHSMGLPPTKVTTWKTSWLRLSMQLTKFERRVDRLDIPLIKGESSKSNFKYIRERLKTRSLAYFIINKIRIVTIIFSKISAYEVCIAAHYPYPVPTILFFLAYRQLDMV